MQIEFWDLVLSTQTPLSYLPIFVITIKFLIARAFIYTHTHHNKVEPMDMNSWVWTCYFFPFFGMRNAPKSSQPEKTSENFHSKEMSLCVKSKISFPNVLSSQLQLNPCKCRYSVLCTHQMLTRRQRKGDLKLYVIWSVRYIVNTLLRRKCWNCCYPTAEFYVSFVI